MRKSLEQNKPNQTHRECFSNVFSPNKRRKNTFYTPLGAIIAFDNKNGLRLNI